MRLKPVVLAVATLFLACGEDIPQKPQIEPDRTEIQFGGEFADAVWVGTTVRETLQLKNGGAEILEISEVAVSGTDAALFGAKIDTKSVDTEQKAFVELSYAPDAVGKHSAVLTVTSNAENTPKLEIKLSATAVAPE